MREDHDYDMDGGKKIYINKDSLKQSVINLPCRHLFSNLCNTNNNTYQSLDDAEPEQKKTDGRTRVRGD